MGQDKRVQELILLNPNIACWGENSQIDEFNMAFSTSDLIIKLLKSNKN